MVVTWTDDWSFLSGEAHNGLSLFFILSYSYFILLQVCGCFPCRFCVSCRELSVLLPPIGWWVQPWESLLFHRRNWSCWAKFPKCPTRVQVSGRTLTLTLLSVSLAPCLMKWIHGWEVGGLVLFASSLHVSTISASLCGRTQAWRHRYRVRADWGSGHRRAGNWLLNHVSHILRVYSQYGSVNQQRSRSRVRQTWQFGQNKTEAIKLWG